MAPKRASRLPRKPKRASRLAKKPLPSPEPEKEPLEENPLEVEEMKEPSEEEEEVEEMQESSEENPQEVEEVKESSEEEEEVEEMREPSEENPLEVEEMQEPSEENSQEVEEVKESSEEEEEVEEVKEPEEEDPEEEEEEEEGEAEEIEEEQEKSGEGKGDEWVESDNPSSPSASGFEMVEISHKKPPPQKDPKPTNKRPSKTKKASKGKKRAKINKEAKRKDKLSSAGPSSLAPGRVWCEEDEITVLRGLIDFKKENGDFLSTDVVAFHDFIRGKLLADISRAQLYDKVRRLRKKFLDNKRKKENGKELVFSKPHDSKAFDLSRKIWGTAEEVQEKVDAEKEDQEIDVTDVDAGGFVSKYPYLSEAICRETPSFGLADSVKNSLKDALSSIGRSKAEELEKKWKEVRDQEAEILLKKMHLIAVQTSLLLEASKKE